MQEFIAQLEAELAKSLERREAAKKERERATFEESRWEQDVRALTMLIARRRNDAAHSGTIDTLHGSAEGYSTADDQDYVSGYEEINRVEWIFKQIANAGAAGILPTEIYEVARNQGLSMHKNYPYVATGKLLERGRIVKVDKRYRVKATEGSVQED
jgi:hypothetical protein